MVIIFVILGLFFGSFVNALVWRIHEQMSKRKPSKNLSIMHGRSMCPHCKHMLAPRDLVPVMSWLVRGGKCRYCKKPIHWQYPVVEIITAGLFAISYLVWPEPSSAVWASSIEFGGWLVILTGLIALAVYDIRWMLLPNRIVYPLMVMATVLVGVSAVASGEWTMLLETLLSVGIAGGIFYLIYIISGGKWIGGGDVKLGVLIGLILQDPFEAFLMLLFASVLGTLLILPGLALKKITVKSKIPFGPFLIMSAIFVVLWGETLITWYKQTILGM